MLINRAEKMRGLSEYAFYEVVSDYNKSVEAKDMIKIREAKALRKDFIKALNEKTTNDRKCSLEYFTPKILGEALNESVGSRVGGDFYGSDGNFMKACMKDYLTMTGISKEISDIRPGRVYPITPYDDRFSEFERVYDNGSRLGGLYVEGDAHLEEVLNYRKRNDTKFYGNLVLSYEDDRAKKPFESFTTYNSFITGNDLSGMAKLKPYIDYNDYWNLSSWVNSESDFSESSETIFKRMKNIDKAKDVLQTLLDEGYSYNVIKDLNPGQIKATIDNTSISVRLTETMKNSAYIGKIYDNGAEVRITSTYQGPNNKVLTYTPTSSDIKNMIKFAMGEEVKANNYPDKVGANGTYTRLVGGKRETYNKSFSSNKKAVFVYNNAVDSKGNLDNKFNNKLNIDFSGENRSNNRTDIRTAERASEYLHDSIDLARKNFLEEIDVNRLIKEASDNYNNPDHDYNLSSDDTISTLQQTYIDLLLDKSDSLLRVGENYDSYNELYDLVINPQTSASDKAIYQNEMEKMIYPLEHDSETVIREHLKDSLDYHIGNFDKNSDGKRYNILGISKYQGLAESREGIKNNLIQSTHLLNIPIDELIADDEYANVLKNQAITFDEKSAKSMKDLDSSFMKSMFETITDSLSNNGYEFDENDILIDDNGIVEYKAKIASTAKFKQNGNYKDITGTIGQIFEPDDLGVIYTKFAGDNNYAFVPGYEATVLPQKDGENLTMEERTKLRGYKQAMISSIKYKIRQDVLETASGRDEIGTAYSLNGTYSHLYDTRHEVDFIKNFEDQGMSRDDIETLVKTEASRVRYQSRFRDNSTVFASYMYDKAGTDKANDLAYTPFNLTGNRDISILTEESDGYFDPIMTTATSSNQGALRYLVEGCKVSDDGMLIKSDDPNDRNILMKQDFMKYVGFNPFDRQNMTVSNILQASSITKPSKTVLTNFGGWNQDDGIVVSKEFADKNMMRGADGNLRSLTIGDKLSDLHGNKGVISLIVDKDMPEEEIVKRGLEKEVDWFRNNPDCEVVMAPFSAPSRFNGGTGREMMSGETLDVKNLDGSISKNSMGEARFIITDKAADVKTHIYDDAELMAGKGRKASSQMAWIYQSKGARGILKECYGDNNKALSDLREYLTVAGFDITDEGKFIKGLIKKDGEDREIFKLPDEMDRTKKGGVKVKAIRSNFLETISKNGGIMEVPFDLKTPAGTKLGMLNADKTDFSDGSEESFKELGLVRKNGKLTATKDYKRSNISFGLPVLSSYLRSSVDLSGDERSFHDYTKSYAGIFESSMKAKNIAQRFEEGEEGLSRAQYKKEFEEYQAKAQKQYNELCEKIEEREFEGKYNVFREGFMSKKMPDSATAIWSENPKNKLEEVSVSKSIANKIHVKDDDYIMIGRDPMLRDGACRYMKVKVDENITGIAVNPCMAKSMDGDFDGDTIAVINFKSKAAKKDGHELFSMKANLLDYGSVREDGTYDLAFHDSLDIKVAGHADNNLSDRLEDLRVNINEHEKAYEEGKISYEEVDKLREESLNGLNDFYKDAYDTGFATATISYDSVEDHLKSIHEACVETGAKGSDAKIQNYAKFFGCSIDLDSEGGLDYDKLEVFNDTLATRLEQMETMGATARKTFGTGLAGTVSQRAVAAGRDKDVKAMLELTYPVTQSLLQAKHNAAEARHKYNMLLGPVRELWNGVSLSQDQNGGWNVNYGDDGKPIQASKDEWVNTFVQMYTSSTADGGLNVSINPKYVNRVADILSDKNGKMISVEDKGFRSSMDILAYGLSGDDKKSGFGYINDLCDEGRSLFETETDKDFAPMVIRKSLDKDNDKIVVKKPSKSYFVKDDLSEKYKKDKESVQNIKTGVLRRRTYEPVKSKEVDDSFSL